MKNRLLLWGCNLLFLTFATVLLSWTPLNTQKQSLFERVVAASESTTINEAEAQQHINSLAKLNKKAPYFKKKSFSGITINWSVSQTGDPYRDANLDVRVYDTLYNWVAGEFEFWTDSDQYANLNYTKLILEVHAPIFDQWWASGTYTLSVEQCYSSSNRSSSLSSADYCNSLHFQQDSRGVGNTPDYYTFVNSYIPIDIANGDIINIYLTATP